MGTRMLEQLEKELSLLKNAEKARILRSFFKTGRGEYGEGDLFLGITVPILRRTAKRYIQLTLCALKELLESKIHEHRLVALLILIAKYDKTDENGKTAIACFFLKNTANINNWDLVDLSSPKILGEYLLDKERSLLYDLAGSSNIWERRISIIATFQFIKNGQFSDTLKIAEKLLKDKHDLIHKAVGWMLRETGKRNMPLEERFLKKNYRLMPRTMLRYAIEKFSEDRRAFYLGLEK